MPIEDLSLLQGPRGDMYAIRERCSSAEHRDQQFIGGSESDDRELQDGNALPRWRILLVPSLRPAPTTWVFDSSWHSHDERLPHTHPARPRGCGSW